MVFELPAAKSVVENPTQAEMREWVLEHMDNVTVTEFGNINYRAEVKARLAPSTFFITEEENFKNRMSRSEYEEWAAKQDAYIADKDMILIEGYIGPDPAHSVPVRRLYMEKHPGQHPGDAAAALLPQGRRTGRREFTVIYTPGLQRPRQAKRAADPG